VTRFEADLALNRVNVRRMPSAEILARYQADARAAAQRDNVQPSASQPRLRAFILAMAAPNSALLR
jgi:hypothetical protein